MQSLIPPTSLAWSAATRLAVTACAVFSATAGCGTTAGTSLPLSGKVTLRGGPLESGSIEFTAEDATRQSGGRIAQGEFRIPAARGLPPGRYVVRITSVEEAAAAPDGPPGPEAAKHRAEDRIPAIYNVRSTLSVEVKSGVENRFDFELE